MREVEDARFRASIADLGPVDIVDPNPKFEGRGGPADGLGIPVLLTLGPKVYRLPFMMIDTYCPFTTGSMVSSSIRLLTRIVDVSFRGK
jgi:hypothetical protein